MSEFIDTPEAVTLIDENGNEEHFLHILTFPYEGEKYAALTPEEQSDDEEPEVLFVRISKDKEGAAYIPVENEVLMEELFVEFESLLDEIEEDDEDEDEYENENEEQDEQ